MLIQWIKVAVSVLLSALAVWLYRKYGGAERRWCMVGMLLSTAADIFMTDVMHLGASSTYPGAGFFIAAHLVYGVCFLRASRKKGYRFANRGFWIGLGISALVFLLLTGAMLAHTGSVQSMYLPILGYMAFIAFNTASQFSYGHSEKGTRYCLTAAMSLFLCSDFLVFLPLLGICGESELFNGLIWLFYVPAQLLIVTFNSDLAKS